MSPISNPLLSTTGNQIPIDELEIVIDGINGRTEAVVFHKPNTQTVDFLVKFNQEEYVFTNSDYWYIEEAKIETVPIPNELQLLYAIKNELLNNPISVSNIQNQVPNQVNVGVNGDDLQLLISSVIPTMPIEGYFVEVCEYNRRRTVEKYMEKLFSDVLFPDTYEYIIETAIEDCIANTNPTFSDCPYSISGGGEVCPDPICVFQGIINQLIAPEQIEEVKELFLKYVLNLSEEEVSGILSYTSISDALFDYLATDNLEFCNDIDNAVLLINELSDLENSVSNIECFNNNYESIVIEGISFLEETCNETNVISLIDEIFTECECNIGGDENWVIYDEENEEMSMEPKWGQLGTCQDIIDGLASLEVALIGLEVIDQALVISEYFNCNIKYARNSDGCVVHMEQNETNPDLCRIKKYVYSNNYGWIDWHHVFKIFYWASALSQSEQSDLFLSATTALSMGYTGEVYQWVADNFSAFAYEDLCSNDLGAVMFLNAYPLLIDGEITWVEVVQEICDFIDATSPQDAPNYEFIPHIINENVPQVFNPLHCLTGDNLYQAAKSEFCNRSLLQRLNIKQIQDEFGH